MSKTIKMLSATLFLLFSIVPPQVAIANDATSTGQEYAVKEGDGLYSLGRMFFNKGIAYKRIIDATNIKAQQDSRFTVIDESNVLEIGQLLWIPTTTISNQPSSNTIKSVSSDDPAIDSHAVKDSQAKLAQESRSTLPKSEQAIIVGVPTSNCEVRLWYNYQVVAINQLNKHWIQQGISLKERARQAYLLRHNARVNGRFMMADRFEVAALKDRDFKKYGHVDGPTFEYLVAKNRERGLKGNDVYNRIIQSSARTNPVFNSSCDDQ